MRTELMVFKGLYGDNSYNPILDFIHHEPLEARSKMYNWEIEEHLHVDLVQLFIIEEGHGLLMANQSKINIDGPSLVIIPASVMHGFAFHEDVKGEVLTFSEVYLDTILKFNPKVGLVFNQLRYLRLELELPIFDQMLWLKNRIIQEMREEGAEKQAFINLLFQSLFLLFYRLHLGDTNVVATSDHKTLAYFSAFQKSIKKSLVISKSVGHYAAELHISTVHLNRVCKKILNKAPIQIIHDFLLVEAKMYLLKTNYSISEIAYFLDFNDPAYFTRFFKKMVGLSPSDFRKN
jgi:AraC family transcriptional regulator, transcriptional activator of pobA